MSRIKDRLCLADNKAKLRQVIKNKTDRIVVERVRKVSVLGPNMDSTPEKLSTNPPPRPL
jgi:hypothetical protein